MKTARDLSNCRALTETEIRKKFGNIAHSTLNLWIKDGCPRHALQYGRRTLYRYYVEEINDWLDEERNRRHKSIEILKKRKTKDKYVVTYPLLGDEEEKKE